MSASRKAPTILAIETAVVDLLYPQTAPLEAIRREFFANLKELVIEGGGQPWFDTNPRPGEMRMIPAEDLDAALIVLAKRHKLVSAQDGALPPQDFARKLRLDIFGACETSAGGSLANTAHALFRSKIDGAPLVTGQFATSVGTDESAKTFTASLAGNINDVSGGRQMECHTFPIDGDRILIGSPSKNNPAEAFITADLFEKRPAKLEHPDRIMLGGFLHFTPGLSAIFNSVSGYLDNVPETKKPSLAITAAAQSIAADKKFQGHVFGLAQQADTVIHANTGEFRRLLNLDTDWRTPFDVDFAGLKGLELDEAKDNHTAYKKAKDNANDFALRAAHGLCLRYLLEFETRLRFVVTDGPRHTYVVSAQGVETFTPQNVSRSQIVNTVGAGDNFAAGFQLGDLYNLPHAQCVALGSAFAASVIQQQAPRLSENRTAQISGKTVTGALTYAPDVVRFLLK